MQQLQRAGEASVTEYMQLLESMSDVAGWESYYNLPIADRPDVSMQGINYWEDQKQVAQQDAQFAAQVEKQEQRRRIDIEPTPGRSLTQKVRAFCRCSC